MYDVDDFSELHYDENYRLLFNLRACTPNFRDRAYIAFDAAFGEYARWCNICGSALHLCIEKSVLSIQDNSLSFLFALVDYLHPREMHTERHTVRTTVPISLDQLTNRLLSLLTVDRLMPFKFTFHNVCLIVPLSFSCNLCLTVSCAVP